MAYHNDEENLRLQIVGSINRAEELLLLTDAGVAAANTKAGLEAFINSVTVHNDQENWKSALKQSIRSLPVSDAVIADLTTVAGLVSALEVSNPNQLILE